MNILAAEREAACKSDDAKELAVAFVASATTETDVGDHACTRYVLLLCGESQAGAWHVCFHAFSWMCMLPTCNECLNVAVAQDQ